MPEESPVTGAKSQQTETELRAEQKPDESARPALTKPLLVKVPTIPATNSPISPGVHIEVLSGAIIRPMCGSENSIILTGY